MANPSSTKVKRAKRPKVKQSSYRYKNPRVGAASARVAANRTDQEPNVGSSDSASFAAAQQAVEHFLSNQPKTFWQGFRQGFRQA